ncbi:MULTISPECIES: type ISP restriction/modification enzyme [unclassified Streptomyces]|uniref:type ISP restriction/modification enzyme n=1 Tax=unclassified Streptomyces TaxID=2593676 RepID=UPI00095F5F1F|nr:type ISP restriction/modification enzyme [Streptomyces sp. TSRI0107]OKJ77330.1 DNA methyltransferase [Streptomyces sp. TSRI0107]
MADARLQWLQEAVSAFGAECKRNLTGPGDREAAIRGPLEQLFRTIAEHHAMAEVSWHPETRIPHLGVRPDYAVRVNTDVTGYIEVKRPGKNIDPDSFTGHDKRQWERLRDLPNLLYTNGTHWRVFQYGAQIGEEVVLSGALKSAGEKLTAGNIAAFDALAQAVLCWEPPKIRRVSVLVQHIAPLCRLLREAVREQLRAETGLDATDPTADRPFTGLRSDWRRLLFPTADDATFADGYAQTVTFALLLAHTEDIPLTGTSFHEIGRRLNAGHALMGKALQLLTDNVTERFEVTLNLLARTVAAVEWDVIRRGNRDAYLHLYESFLSVYDDSLRQRSGSYYTPHQVVEEMVRLAEEVLRTRLGKARGYGDESVHIVDPAMGTGTYLHTIIERVARQAAERHGDAMAPDAIGRLAERLYGFELQMGPFAVAELRTADLLKKHGAQLPPGGLNLHVTDTLDDPYVQEEQLASTYAALSVSRARANHVKANVPVTVVISNPPYDDKAENRGGWIEKRVKGQGRPPLDDFRHPGNGRYEHALKNMYVYFWRWATWKVFDAHPDDRHGVVCFITPSAFATGPAGRGMRDYLRRTCDEGWIINLSPEGQRSDVATRVFPHVAQPLSVCVFVRRADHDSDRPARIHYRALHGRRAEKFEQLRGVRLDDEGWRDAHSQGVRPFTPATLSGWDDYPALEDLLPWGSPGNKTNRSWVTSPSDAVLRRRWSRLVAEADPEVKALLFKETDSRSLDTRPPSLPGFPHTDRSLRSELQDRPRLLRIGLRSFDRQWLIADHRVIDRPRAELWEALQPGQLFLNQQSSHEINSGPALVATALLPDTHHFNGRGGRVHPVLHPDGSANVPTGLLRYLAGALGLEQVTVHDLAAYALAVAGHSAFTEQFAEELLTPGVRLPLTRDPELWQEAVRVGREFLWAATYGEVGSPPDAPASGQDGVGFPSGDPRQVRYTAPIGSAVPDTLTYDKETSTLHVGPGTFTEVPPEVWNYEVGGMHVIKKWFGYRKASPTSRKTSPLDDIHVTAWPREWTEELIELLSVLRRLVDLAPVQQALTSKIVSSPVITVADLTSAGVLPPQPGATRARRRVVLDFGQADES